MSVKVIKIREIPGEEAKSEIGEYLKSRDKAWLNEISDGLRLDLASRRGDNRGIGERVKEA